MPISPGGDLSMNMSTIVRLIECDNSVQFLTFYQIWFLRFRVSSGLTIVIPVNDYTLYFEVCSGYLTIITACCNNTILLEIIAKQIIGPHDEHEVSFVVS